MAKLFGMVIKCKHKHWFIPLGYIKNQTFDIYLIIQLCQFVVSKSQTFKAVCPTDITD